MTGQSRGLRFTERGKGASVGEAHATLYATVLGLRRFLGLGEYLTMKVIDRGESSLAGFRSLSFGYIDLEVHG
jgi:hypothetical protein